MKSGLLLSLFALGALAAAQVVSEKQFDLEKRGRFIEIYPHPSL